MDSFLVVIDMQNDFIDGALGTAQAQACIENASKRISSFSGEVFVTFDTHGDNYLKTQEGIKLPVPHCIKGATGWELNSEISHALQNKNYIAIEKPSFGSLELAQKIKEASKSDKIEIYLLGLCTDICVVSNALVLKSSMPEARIYVYADACAGVTPQTHEAALTTMKSCQIEII